jgi:ATP-dependent Clp protease ATP-binding subunit ClpB
VADVDKIPAWATELRTLLPASPHFVLSGNVHDVYLVDAGGLNEVGGGNGTIFSELLRLVAGVIRGRGVDVVLTCEALAPVSIFNYDGEVDSDVDGKRSFIDDALGASFDTFDTTTLSGLASLIEAVTRADRPLGLVVTGASRLVRNASGLSEDEFDFFRRIERCSRNASPIQPSLLFNPVIWVVENESDLPAWYDSQNDNVRTIVLPIPDVGNRLLAAQRYLPKSDHPDQSSPAEELAAHSAGLTLVEMRRAVSIGRDQGLDPTHIEDAVRSYRVGTVDNPWRREYVKERLKQQLDGAADRTTEGDAPTRVAPEELLSNRVLGQENAVQKTLDILVRSVTGLTGAQAAASASRPRGVLFFAGPTGVGKTELAKALTRLLFDDENLCTRFDMSEFSAEHAADRLIGSPPGYEGNAAGGELTNAMRQRPFSVVLFDEIEKAHPRILDKFLQVLDDGRLTDGRGETAYFTEAVIVFTSNLGIYEETDVVNDDGSRSRRREMTAGPELSHEDFAQKVTGSIKDYFTREIGRPELLNRIGDNIVVFDFITRDVGLKILAQMLRRLTARVEQEYRVLLKFDPKVEVSIAEACVNDETLELGGRGIGSKLETVVVNPLANEIFTSPPVEGSSLWITELEKTGSGWKIGTRCD